MPKLLSVSENPYTRGLVRWDARWRAGAFRTARLVAVDRYYQRYALIISASIRAWSTKIKCSICGIRSSTTSPESLQYIPTTWRTLQGVHTPDITIAIMINTAWRLGTQWPEPSRWLCETPLKPVAL